MNPVMQSERGMLRVLLTNFGSQKTEGHKEFAFPYGLGFNVYGIKIN